MARIRTIKPEFWTDEKIGSIKRDIRLLFIGLWNLADDDGVLKANPAYIKGQLFAFDDELRTGTVKEWLDALENARMVIPFSHNRESYYVIRSFKSHQKINRPTPSKIPLESIKSALFGDSCTHGVITEHSPQERKGKEGKGKEGNGMEFMHERDEKLENEVLEYFGFNSITNFDKARTVNDFIFSLKNSDQLENFKNQFFAYCEYKKLSQSFVHSFQNFIGRQKDQFQNGAWNSENWGHKLREEKEKNCAKKENYVGPSERGIEAALEFGNVKMRD